MILFKPKNIKDAVKEKKRKKRKKKSAVKDAEGYSNQ